MSKIGAIFLKLSFLQLTECQQKDRIEHKSSPSMKTFLLPLTYILIFLVGISYFSTVQGQDNKEASIEVASLDTLKKSQPTVKTLNHIEENQFNKGRILDPLHLIQGHSAALFTSRAGNDPNEAFDLRIRGIKSFDITEPLILVDGMPVYSLDIIHPNDIGSVEVLTDAVSLANWGIRGANGILSIKTKRGLPGKMRVNYHVSRSIEGLTQKPDILSGSDYARYGGNNLGAETDWWEEVTQQGRSINHHLSLSGGDASTNYFASLNYDDVSGIVLRSGFERLNGRFYFQKKALQDRINIQVGLASTTRNSAPTPLIAMWHATSHNPTAPVYSESGPDDPYGGFFEIPFIFNTYNPVSILLQNDFQEQQKNLSMHINTDVQITDGLEARFMYGRQAESESRNSYYASTSFYVGVDRNGLGFQTNLDVENEYATGGLYFDKDLEALKLDASLSYHYQNIDEQYFNLSGGNFLTDAFTINNMSAARDFANGRGVVDSYRQQNELSRFNGTVGIELQDKYKVSASVSREGSSRLGLNNKWGIFYGIQALAKVNQSLYVRANLSKTGNIPSRGYLSQGTFGPTAPMFYNGEYNESYGKYQQENPDLGPETTTDWSLGADFSLFNQRLRGSLDYYQSYARNLIQQVSTFDTQSLGLRTYLNTGGINSSGLEASLRYAWINTPKTTWNVGLNAAFYGKTTLESYAFPEGVDFAYIGIMGGRCAFPIYRIEEGAALGDIWGYQLNENREVNENNEWNVIDQDGDGQRTQTGDYVSIGNGMPKAVYGISNNIRWNNFHIDFLMRGVLGHDVINHIKSFHSVRSIISHYNVNEDAVTELASLEDYADFNSRDVEGASFLRLAFLNIGYNFELKKSKAFRQIRLYISTQNLFTISGYGGLDPELRLEDVDSRTPTNIQGYYGQIIGDVGNPLVLGMDRRNSYPMSRTMTVGLDFTLQ